MRNKLRVLRTRKMGKQVLAVFLILVVFTGVAMKFWTKEASAAWFDENWGYRQAVTVTVSSNGSDIKSLETLLTVDTSTLITAGKLQSSCQDLRFTNNSGKLLPYYIDSGCNTSTTKVWVMVDTVPANTTTYNMYEYYGNPSAPAGTDSQKFNLFRGLVGYWGMNETANSWNGTSGEVKDFSAQANHGTGSGFSSSSPTSSGKYSNAGSFDGVDDTISVPYTSSLDTSGSFTWTAWINPTAFSGLNYIFSDTSQTLRFLITSASTVQFPSGCSTGSFSTAMQTGVWQQIVATFNRTTGDTNIYLNGKLVTSGICTPPGGTTSTRYIGGPLTRFFNGSMDEMRMYNRVLSPSEVSQLYQNPGTIASYASTNSLPTTSFATEEKAPQPVAYWKFDEGTGTVANDSTTNKNTGTLSGATLPTWQTEDQCVIGKCLYFDGVTSYVNAPNVAALYSDWGTNTFTISTWVKTKTNTVDQSVLGSFSATDIVQMRINASGTNKLEGYMRGSSNCGFVGTTSSFPTNTWQLATLVYDKTNLILYLNGVRQSSTACNISSVNLSGFYLGYITGGVAIPLNGYLDDTKIYAYARTAAQIKADYTSRGTAIGSSATLGNNANNNLAALNQGLVGYWKMNEATWSGTLNEVLDSSGNGNNGQARGATNAKAYPGAGKFGNGGVFDGIDDFVNAPDMALGTNRTFSGWIYPTSVPAGIKVIFAKRQGMTTDAGTDEWFLYLNAGKLAGYIVPSSGSTVNVTGATTIIANTWQHVALQYDGASLKVFLNEQLDGTTTSSFTPKDGTAPYHFGDDGAGDRFFAGKMDEYRVYNRALSPADVANLYNFAPGPVGYWKMDEKSGTSAKDNSGNGNSGVLTNGPTWVNGKVGGAVNFDGANDHIRITDNDSLDMGLSDYSINFWMKPQNANSIMTIIQKGNPYNLSGVGYNLNYRGDLANDPIQLQMNDGNAGAAGGWTINAGDLSDRWHHVAMSITRNGTAILYVDGVLKGTSASVSTFSGNISNSSDMFLGALSGVSFPFQGQLDEVKVYNYARTQKQILSDMQSGAPSVTSTGKSTLGYWRMDEGYGTSARDSSGNGNTGTITNMSSPAASTSGWSNSGKFGKALSFDGTNDYVTMGNVSSLNPSGSFSISTWINPTSLTSSVILSKTASVGNYGYYLAISASTLQLAISGDGTTVTARNSPALLTANTWQHVVVNFDSSSTVVTIYVNGKKVSTSSATGVSSIFASTGNFQISGTNGASNPFPGKIDETKMYNYALSDAEVKQEYNRGSALVMGAAGNNAAYASGAANQEYCVPGDSASCAAPVGEWKMDEGQGTSVNDTSGNGNTGTWSGTGGHWVSGKFNKAGSFNGADDYVSIPSASSLSPGAGDFTQSAWIKISAPNLTGLARFIISNYGLTTTNLVQIALGTDGKVVCGARDGSSNLAQISAQGAALNDGKWHYLSCVRSGTTVLAYIDGALLATATNASLGTIDTTGRAKTIGTYAGTPGTQNFLGIIDQVKMYNYARSAAQVAWEYNKGLPVAWYRMDECQGTSVRDSSGNNNTGTLTVGATGTQTSAGTCQTSSTAWGNGAIGKINNSLNFDGTDDVVTVPNTNGKFDFTSSDFSLATWVNSSDYSNFREIISTRDSVANKGYLLYTQSSHVKYTPNNGVGGVYTGTTTLVNNTWYHILITYINSTKLLSVYLNGSLEGTRTLTTNPISSGGNLGLGNDILNSDTISYKGQLDDVRIYNYALSSTQAKTLYTGGAVRFGPVTGTP